MDRRRSIFIARDALNIDSQSVTTVEDIFIGRGATKRQEVDLFGLYSVTAAGVANT